jgi:hypothetical protein
VTNQIKETFLKIVRNPVLNLGINVFMFLLNGGACITQYLTGNLILANILLMSTVSCVTAVLYWAFVVWDKKNLK